MSEKHQSTKHQLQKQITEKPAGRTVTSRRGFLKRAGAGAALVMLPAPAVAQGAGGRAVVIGGGFAGATCARFIKRLDARIGVTLLFVMAFVVCIVQTSPIPACCSVSPLGKPPLVRRIHRISEK